MDRGRSGDGRGSRRTHLGRARTRAGPGPGKQKHKTASRRPRRHERGLLTSRARLYHIGCQRRGDETRDAGSQRDCRPVALGRVSRDGEQRTWTPLQKGGEGTRLGLTGASVHLGGRQVSLARDAGLPYRYGPRGVLSRHNGAQTRSGPIRGQRSATPRRL